MRAHVCMCGHTGASRRVESGVHCPTALPITSCRSYGQSDERSSAHMPARPPSSRHWGMAGGRAVPILDEQRPPLRAECWIARTSRIITSDAPQSGNPCRATFVCQEASARWSHRTGTTVLSRQSRHARGPVYPSPRVVTTVGACPCATGFRQDLTRAASLRIAYMSCYIALFLYRNSYIVKQF